jgi:hypothetical protein
VRAFFSSLHCLHFHYLLKCIRFYILLSKSAEGGVRLHDTSTGAATIARRSETRVSTSALVGQVLSLKTDHNFVYTYILLLILLSDLHSRRLVEIHVQHDLNSELLLLSLSAKPHPQSYSFRPPPLSPTTHCEPLSISDARVDRRLFGPIICVVALQANVSGSKVGHSILPSYLSLELHDLSTVISGKNLKVPSRRVPAGIYVSINVDSRRCWKPVISILSSSESVAWGDTDTVKSMETF